MSFTEIVILAVLGLIVLGPEELPVMARKAARMLNELRRVKDEILGPMAGFNEEAQKLLTQNNEELHKNIVDLMNLRNKIDQELTQIRTTNPQAPTPTTPVVPEPTTPPAEKKPDGST